MPAPHVELGNRIMDGVAEVVCSGEGLMGGMVSSARPSAARVEPPRVLAHAKRRGEAMPAACWRCFGVYLGNDLLGVAVFTAGPRHGFRVLAGAKPLSSILPGVGDCVRRLGLIQARPMRHDQAHPHKAEYAKRIARGLSQSLSRSQARDHPKPQETPKRVSTKSPKFDRRLKEGFKALRIVPSPGWLCCSNTESAS
jgi:hypothetical protein